jgi:DNA repair photolyase
LTKAGLSAVRDLDLFRRRHRWNAAAATLTFADPEDSARWEPNAATPDSRIEMLRAYHEAGIRTWVSCEPVIYPEQTLQLIRDARPFVDEFRLGGTNHTGKFPPDLRAIVDRIDWQTYTRAAVALCEELAVAHYVKEDLRPYLDKNAAK